MRGPPFPPDAPPPTSTFGSSPRRRALPVALALAVLFGAGIRVALSLRLPVGYDEVFVIAVGLLDMETSTDALIVETPMQRSSGTAPLWWWVEYGVYRLAGELSLVVLRLAPVVLGLALLPWCWYRASRRLGRRAAWIMTALLASSDIVAFLNSRCDFFESLFLVFLVPAVCATGAPRRGTARGFWWAGMALTFLGKALFVIALNGWAELVILSTIARGRRRRLLSLVRSGLIAGSIVGVWLIFAQGHYAGRTIPHEAGEAGNVWSLVSSLTLGYQTTKSHVTGTWRDALQVWSDARVWPETVLTLVAALTAFVLAVRTLCGTRHVAWTRRRTAMLGLLAWSIAGLTVIVARGTAGARFHVLYLPALWLLIALIGSSRRAMRSRGWIALPLASIPVVAIASGWTDWARSSWDAGRAAQAGAALLVPALIVVGVAWRRRLRTRTTVCAMYLTLCVVCAALAGPLQWAPFAEFEPMLGTRSLAQLDAVSAGRRAAPTPRRETLYLLLANYYLTRDELPRAERFALLATRDRPRDETSWFYLGLVYDAQGRPAAQRREVWQRAYELKPDSARIRVRLGAVPPD